MRCNGPNGGTCELCPADFYCPGGTVNYHCPEFSQSFVGSHLITNCSCKPGFVADSNGVPCTMCPRATYCPGGTEIFECSSNSSSTPGSFKIEQCICNHGLWRNCIITHNGTMENQNGSCVIDYTDTCVECGEDVICANNTLLHCPDHSSSPRASDHHSDCVCLNGFYLEPAS